MTEMSTELVVPGIGQLVPGIGQLVDLDQPREVALAIDAIRDLEYQLRAAKQDLTRALVHASQQEGTKTLRYEGVEVVVKGGSATHYDAAAIYSGLIDAGMSEQRAGEIVKHEVITKVDAAQAKRASAANPEYAAVIAANTSVVDTPYSVSVSHAKETSRNTG
jgi:hypothetical protein